ncbi:sugar ABC transporter substrate-binding protein [Bradyrhizobium sp. 143]|uniref:sugar ABC transporter substrate-binding protein n=1 Tax=Bradyrhizobium sp. 143 TaxID=2782619 RepID=UPI001FFB0804|nr:sugar ABC transporter substrate-binding protein [Bradyrhizobium sp. 143]MCK1708332.1 sugar ABC transporter substrate-binding protein [Bradyrhizobium sp. 143]
MACESDRGKTDRLSLLSGELLAMAAGIRENPRFEEALCVFARDYVEPFKGDPLLSKIATDEARHLLRGHIVFLHYRRDIGNPESGIALHRLQEFATMHGLCGKNRVAALIRLLRHADYLRPVRRDGDRRVMRLEPTELARGALRKFIVAYLKALDALNGDESLQSRFERDDRLPEAIVANTTEMYFDNCRILDAVPEMRLFSGRDAGFAILLRLWTMFDPTRSTTGQVVSFPYGSIAKYFGVSRAHVRRLMETAALEGYFVLHADGGRAVGIRPSLVELVKTYMSLHLALYQCAVIRVNAEVTHAASETFRSSIEGRSIEPTGATNAMAATFAKPAVTLAKRPGDYRFCLSVPFTGQDSFRRIIAGYKDAVSKLGGSLTIADAKWDVKKQTEQIASFIASKPDALFILPADPGAVSRSIQAATEAGIPTFLCDSYVPGATAQSTSMHNHFAMGAAAAEYICKRLKGKGNIAIVDLPSNEAWSTRSDGLRFVLSRYPDIKVVAECAFALTGLATPQEAIAEMLVAHQNIDAIWNAWDGGAVGAALAIRAAGRCNIFATGIDGGSEAFEYIKSGSAFCFTVAQSFYEEAYLSVYYAHEVLAGRRAPRIIVNPAYAVTRRSGGL